MRYFNIIVAMNEDRVIGADGKMFWYYPDDLKRFKKLTKGGSVIMGRQTWDSLTKKPLPGRANYVLTKDSMWKGRGAISADSFRDALTFSNRYRSCWVIGGGMVYEEALKYPELIERIEVTLVPDKTVGKNVVRFPELGNEWVISKSEKLGVLTFNTYVEIQ